MRYTYVYIIHELCNMEARTNLAEICEGLVMTVVLACFM